MKGTQHALHNHHPVRRHTSFPPNSTLVMEHFGAEICPILDLATRLHSVFSREYGNISSLSVAN